MDHLTLLKEQIENGHVITKEECMMLWDADLDQLAKMANELRIKMYGDGFDLCTIINAKSGMCSENCRFCAQSSHYSTAVEQYPLLDEKEIVDQAIHHDQQGVLRYSIVTSGKKVSRDELNRICQMVKEIKKNSGIDVCVSLGLLNQEEFTLLKEAGVSRIHNNLESSSSFYPNICTTHTHEDKIASIKAAQNAGLTVCSGGIIGLGETREDRIDMALELRNLNITSIPINMLNPIKGTPLEGNEILNDEEMIRTCAIYRFILPKAQIRLAGGRGLLADKGKSCFLSGANAAITGDMLTTAGISVEDDIQTVTGLGYEIKEDMN